MRRVALLGLVLLPVLAEADEVFIRGGGHLSGDVVERGPDFIMVDIGSGRIGLLLSSVDRIVPGATAVGLYRQRAASLNPGDVAGWLALGRWARDHDLNTNAREAFEYVLAVEPANTAAHRALGHVQLDGQWMTQDESYGARGYVPFEGGWVTPEERRGILDERRAVAEERRAHAEAEARIREAEARARAAEADAQRAEAELRRAEAREIESSGFVGDGWRPWFAGVYPAFSTGFYPAFHPRFHPAFRSRCHAFAAGPPLRAAVHSVRTRAPMRTFSSVAGNVGWPAPTFGRHSSKRWR